MEIINAHTAVNMLMEDCTAEDTLISTRRVIDKVHTAVDTLVEVGVHQMTVLLSLPVEHKHTHQKQQRVTERTNGHPTARRVANSHLTARRVKRKPDRSAAKKKEVIEVSLQGKEAKKSAGKRGARIEMKSHNAWHARMKAILERMLPIDQGLVSWAKNLTQALKEKSHSAFTHKTNLFLIHCTLVLKHGVIKVVRGTFKNRALTVLSIMYQSLTAVSGHRTTKNALLQVVKIPLPLPICQEKEVNDEVIQDRRMTGETAGDVPCLLWSTEESLLHLSGEEGRLLQLFKEHHWCSVKGHLVKLKLTTMFLLPLDRGCDESKENGVGKVLAETHLWIHLMKKILMGHLCPESLNGGIIDLNRRLSVLTKKKVRDVSLWL